MTSTSGNGRGPQNRKKTTSSSNNNSYRKTNGTSTKRKSPAGSRKYEEDEEIDFDLLKMIGFICCIGLVIFLFLCTIGTFSSEIDGSLNFCDYISRFMFGIFGINAYIVPIAAFLLTWFIKVNSRNIKAYIKFFSIIALIVSVGVFFHVGAYGNDLITTEKFAKDFYVHAYSNSFFNKGGGILFGSIAFGLSKLLSNIGCIFFTIVLSFVSIILIFDKFFKKFFTESKTVIAKGSEKIKDEYDKLDDEEEEDEYIKKGRTGKTLNDTFLAPENSVSKQSESEKKNFKIMDGFSAPSVVNKENVPEETDKTVLVKPVNEKKDIHRIIIKDDNNKSEPEKNTTYDDEEWLQPVSSKNESSKENIAETKVITPVPVSNTKDISEITPAFDENIYDKTENVETPEPEKKNVHLRSRDKNLSFDEGSKSIKKPSKANYVLPPLNLLESSKGVSSGNSDYELQQLAATLESTLDEFKVKAKVTNYTVGPSVIRFELQPDHGVKVSSIKNLEDDIKLNLAASNIRIEAPIPGKSAVGIEIPNKEKTAVAFGDIVKSDKFANFDSKVAFAIGKDISGENIVFDIAKMPHVLIAGQTGSGKSVCINTLIMSILYKAKPDEVKLVMIDPKVVELNIYNGLPHMPIPVVTDPKKATSVLQWCVKEMDNRYRMFAEANARDIKSYNKIAESQDESTPEAERIKKLPLLVIIVDELADLMMVASKDVEASITRLAQLARAAGIHLVIATQRPSVDVITGIIKANMPSRIAFSVTSGIDSRTILDKNGAEKLLGKGDMLFYPAGYSDPVRVQGCFVSDSEIANVVDYIKGQKACSSYTQESMAEEIESSCNNSDSGESSGQTYDELFAEAGRLFIKSDKATIGVLQRVFSIGFNRAARIMDQLEEAGCVGPDEGKKPRKVLMNADEFEDFLNS